VAIQPCRGGGAPRNDILTTRPSLQLSTNPMLRKYPTPGAGLFVVVLSLAIVPRSLGQAAAAQSATAASAETTTEVVVLSPFVVDAAEDQNGYRASSTLAGTRVRTDLKDLASSISVVTRQFLQDTNSRNSHDLLVYTPSTEVTGIRGNFTGVAGATTYKENTLTATTRVRGLDPADNTRDYYLTDIPWDVFNVGRVDLQRGPNSILFGIGSPAGIINTSTNDASFKNAYHVEAVVDQYGSNRLSLDLNQNLADEMAALRFAAVKEHRNFEQDPAFHKNLRYYGALRFDPKIFGDDNHTSVRAKYEAGRTRSNEPRQLPPGDQITPWFKTGVDAYGNPGYDKLTINQFSLTNPNPSGVPMPGGTYSTLATATYEMGGLSAPGDIINYYEGTQPRLNGQNGKPPSGTPVKTITGAPNMNNAIADPATQGTRWLAMGSDVTGVGGYFATCLIPSMSWYSRNVGPYSNLGFTYPGGAIPGGLYYADVVLTDPTIFNFYRNLLDGPNKREWQNWNAYNVAIDQSFFNDRLAFELAFDHQVYDAGSVAGSANGISIDVNQTYADASANPNVGRPYVIGGSGGNSAFSTVRDTARFVATADLKARDLLGDTRLARILGQHHLTGLAERNTIDTNNVGWTEFATTPAYGIDNNSGFTRSKFNWIVYLAPSLASASSAHGANLSNIPYVVQPPRNQSVWNFNSNWNRPISPGAPGYVDPYAPFSFTHSIDGNVWTFSQASNPANYVGWQNYPVNWMFANDPTEFPSLVTSASRTNFRNLSRAFTWQGDFLDGALKPTFGWRKDVITNFATNAVTDPTSGFTSLNYPTNIASRTDVRGESRSWGAVYHLPKAIVARLPWDMTVSLHYNDSQNFKADATRLAVDGIPIPNATGRTRDYGVTVTALAEKLSLKVTWFKTRIANATLSETDGNSIAGLGANAYFIADGIIWGYGWATALQDGLRGQTPGSSYWNYAGGSNLPRNTPEEIAAYDAFNQRSWDIVNAWLNIPLPTTFFSSYSLSPPIDATIGHRTGNLRDSYYLGIDDTNGPVTGGGSTFGNHQITIDNLSKGVEIELSAQPLKNWNLTLNYSKVKATHEQIDAAAQRFIGDITQFMNGPGGQIRMWFNTEAGSPIMNQWNASIVAPFAAKMNELGHEAPEMSPWRLNLVTTYTVDHGPIKGAFAGGALRAEGGRIIGYRYSSTFHNSISDDPRYAQVVALTLGGLDVNQPFRGENETHIDAWVGYSRKLTHNLNWRIQLNVRSVGEKDRLVAARINPDGGLALARIVQGMGWELTNALDF